MPFSKLSPSFLIGLLLLVFSACQNEATTSSHSSEDEAVSTTTPQAAVSDAADPSSNPSIKPLPDSLVRNMPTTEPSKNLLPQWPMERRTNRGQIFPFDEAPKDPSLVAFRQKLYDAVLDQDVDFIKANMSKDIKFSFGAEGGFDQFLATWELDQKPQQSRFWEEMETVLRWGGGFSSNQDSMFMAPYVFVTDKIEEPFDQAIVLGEGVRLREGPSSDSKILNALSFDLVTMLQVDYTTIKRETIGGEEHAWQKVRTLSGEEGYIFSKYLRLAIDYRLILAKRKNRWGIDVFIAGD